jgi:hypothetical protein
MQDVCFTAVMITMLDTCYAVVTRLDTFYITKGYQAGCMLYRGSDHHVGCTVQYPAVMVTRLDTHRLVSISQPQCKEDKKRSDS